MMKEKKVGMQYIMEKNITGDTYFSTRFPSEEPILLFLWAMGLETAKYRSNVSTNVI